MAGVKGNSGRKKVYRFSEDTPQGASAIEILNLATPEASQYLRCVCNGEERRHEWARIDAAKFILQQHLSQLKAQGLIDETGRRIVSYKVLVLMAQQFIAESSQQVLVEGVATPTQGMVLPEAEGLQNHCSNKENTQ